MMTLVHEPGFKKTQVFQKNAQPGVFWVLLAFFGYWVLLGFLAGF